MRKAAYVVLAALPVCAAVTPPSGVIASLVAPANEAPAFALRAEGFHIFECKPVASDPTRYAWAFSAPDATLYDAGRAVARTASENTFEGIADRSTVTGVVRSRQNAGDTNLPWLLLRAQATPDGGLFAGVTSIQRVNTSGGVAPAEGCSDTNVGKEARVPFAADYYFYKRAG